MVYNIKSQIWKLKEGDRVETSRDYSIHALHYNNQQKMLGADSTFMIEEYHRGAILHIHRRVNCNGSLINFKDEITGELKSMDEFWLKPLEGERYKSGQLITNITIEDILNSKKQNQK